MVQPGVPQAEDGQIIIIIIIKVVVVVIIGWISIVFVDPPF